jgi:hypothetical protein
MHGIWKSSLKGIVRKMAFAHSVRLRCRAIKQFVTQAQHGSLRLVCLVRLLPAAERSTTGAGTGYVCADYVCVGHFCSNMYVCFHFHAATLRAGVGAVDLTAPCSCPSL